ncbi:MAG: hypothetical protein WCS31_09015 [Verrucomicrobiae bacterium]
MTGDDPEKGGNLFLWTVIILLLSGFAIACWIGSFYIFEHPETPLSYEVLTKLKKLEPPKRFELTAAPRGEFLKPAQILERYQKMTPRELMHANEVLLKNYIRNYKLTQDLVLYVAGTFHILDSYELTKDDFWGSGVVVLAQAKDNPKILVEQIFPAQAKAIPALQRTLLTGLDLDLKRENELSAILHVEKLGDGRIKVTALSILYPSYGSAAAAGTFSLEPPELLNVAAGLPVITDGRLQEADTKFAAYRRRAGLTGSSAPAPQQPRLMRVERPVAVNTPPPTSLPANPPVLAAIPVNAPPTALPANPTVLAAIPVNAPPSALPAIPVNALPANPPVLPAIPVNAPSEPPSAEPAAPEPAAPASSPAPATIPAPGSWPVYEPGQMPRGRLLNVKDVAGKAGGGVGSERVYLQGSFLVTASGPSRAVLRTQGALTDAIGLGGRSGDVRVIVDFPSGMIPPAKEATFSRDARRPFQITGVKEDTDGQINVYVREVTRP